MKKRTFYQAYFFGKIRPVFFPIMDIIIIFSWTIPTFIKGYKRGLDDNDLYGALKDHESRGLGTKLENAWVEENERDEPSLSRAIWKVFGKQICFYGFILFILEFGTRWDYSLFLWACFYHFLLTYTLSKQQKIYVHVLHVLR